MKPTVYLAGPIAGCTYAGATGWRYRAAHRLHDLNMVGLSPMREKRRLVKGELTLGAVIGRDFNEYSDLGPSYTSRGIMMRDHNDVHRADALLVNLLGTTTPSFGTVMELGWAYHQGTPVVVAIEPGNVHLKHPMVREAIGGLMYEDLDEAIDAVASVLGL